MTALTADRTIIAGLQRARDRDPRDDRDRESVLEAQAGRGGVRVPQGHRLLRPQLEGAEGGGEDSQAEAADTGRGPSGFYTSILFERCPCLIPGSSRSA